MSRRAAGLRAWVSQRVTAVYLAVYLVYLGLRFVGGGPETYAEWKAWAGDPAVAVFAGLFFVSLLLHAWVGVRDVIMDYVWNAGARFAALAVLGLVLVAYGIWAARILIVAGL
ncbi:succinate dehydrogenase, hydrophobic membrane anchor protein [Inmirania thermothiophila]|uniref:Succinate dehydrogenase hydrophobic membrane anchor subunit n=1 Tax=Inmirania thermothiophila TaxID=1750597 RepID=A0A3N1XZU8_9GAMM|nr:succinate dehydrogenase, hydrophobic membrane anchor protein [Inmirania thermothiophila]ROR32116.1 succinate dehydrogenase subunit D [Inmirania thermothiophila]